MHPTNLQVTPYLFTGDIFSAGVMLGELITNIFEPELEAIISAGDSNPHHLPGLPLMDSDGLAKLKKYAGELSSERAAERPETLGPLSCVLHRHLAAGNA
jgi:hypothetical protein